MNDAVVVYGATTAAFKKTPPDARARAGFNGNGVISAGGLPYLGAIGSKAVNVVP